MADSNYIPSPAQAHPKAVRGGSKEDRARSAIYKTRTAECCSHHPDAHDASGCLLCPCASQRQALPATPP